jgi:tryptophan 2,3-dioxygenase
MTPMSFSAFRERLDTASGFQSFQFRELEFVLGLKRPEMLEHAAGPKRGPRSKSGCRALGRWTTSTISSRTRASDPRRAARKRVTAANAQRGAPARAPAPLQARPELAILFESMTDLDEGFQEWKYRHVKLVERTIGNKKGTGGSLGVEFLKQSLFKPIFPDLWAIRHEL